MRSEKGAGRRRGAGAAPAPRRLGRRAAAVLAGLVAIFVLSLGTDAALHAAGLFPRWGRPSDGLFLLATLYRTVYGVLGCWVAARLAPDRPMRHALALGALGVAPSAAGAAATWSKMPEIGSRWYALALVAISLPCAWVGGKLAGARPRPEAAEGAAAPGSR